MNTDKIDAAIKAAAAAQREALYAAINSARPCGR